MPPSPRTQSVYGGSQTSQVRVVTLKQWGTQGAGGSVACGVSSYPEQTPPTVGPMYSQNFQTPPTNRHWLILSTGGAEPNVLLVNVVLLLHASSVQVASVTLQ